LTGYFKTTKLQCFHSETRRNKNEGLRHKHETCCD